MDDSFDIYEELKRLPQLPGVYIMHGQADEIIYVGKAVNLRNRVRNYFQPASAADPKVRNIVANVVRFEYIVTDTEMEALLLECNLIKSNQPRYNVLLKDDKAFPFIQLTSQEEFPRAFVVRNPKRDKSKYFGPYTSSVAVSETLELLHQIWPLRTCTRNISHINGSNNQKACLNFHIGRCLAPCEKRISKQEYDHLVNEAERFLSGKREDVLANLQKKMLSLSDELAFEKAADIRNKIQAIHKLDEKQKLDSFGEGDQDIIAFARKDDEAMIQIFFMRNGRLTGREHFMLSGVSLSTDEEMMTEFVVQFYSGTSFVPKELVLQVDVCDKETVTSFLALQKGSKVSLVVPQKGEKKQLVQLAMQNANITMNQFGEQMKRDKERTQGALLEIQKALGTENPLQRIEAYDISHIFGVQSVGSMVVFEDGKPKRNEYRKFKMKTVVGNNDYASIEEVLTRRFLRYQSEISEPAHEANKFSKLPNAIFVDGGAPQVLAVESVLKRMDLSILVCGMFKDDKHRTKGLLYNGKEILLPHTSEGFKLLTRMQDEVHRFAITYHKKLREKSQIHSVLDDIKGVGERRKKALMKHFGSIDAIANANVEDLSCIPTMDKRAARCVYDFFHRNDTQ